MVPTLRRSPEARGAPERALLVVPASPTSNAERWPNETQHEELSFAPTSGSGPGKEPGLTRRPQIAGGQQRTGGLRIDASARRPASEA